MIMPTCGSANQMLPAAIAISARSRPVRGHRPAPSTTAPVAIARNTSGVTIGAKYVSLYARYVSGWPMRGLLCAYWPVQ